MVFIAYQLVWPVLFQVTIKAGTHWPKRWTNETLTQTSWGTNLFGQRLVRFSLRVSAV